MTSLVSPAIATVSLGSGGEAPVVRPTALANSLIRCGFFGSRAVSLSPVVSKEVSSVPKGKDSTPEIGSSFVSPSLPVAQKGVQSSVAAVLPASQVCTSSNGVAVMESRGMVVLPLIP